MFFRIPGASYVTNTFKSVPYVFVADDAFSLMPNMLKPFSKRHLTKEERIFNYRLSRARRMIENVFGILTTKWRILKTTINTNVDLAENIVLATVSLHNWLRRSNEYMTPGLVDTENINGDFQPGSWRSDGDTLSDIQAITGNSLQVAKDVRNNFANYFAKEGAVEWQNSKI